MQVDDAPVVPGYTLVHRVGGGASGAVWRARRQADDLVVALKIVQARDGDLSQALREAAVLSRVRHPHVLHLYDVLPLPDLDGRPAGLGLAVQFAAGGSLAQVLAARRLLTAGELVTLVSPVAGALADLHRAGVVHGDLSPGNVLFLADGMPMLADLGVARLVGEPVAAVHGTDGMVAPEVLEGFAPGPEADVYALGALAWLCLTGEEPGWVGTRGDLVDLAPDASEGMRDLVLRCLAPEPEDRPEAEEVATVVLGLAQPAPIEVAPGADPGTSLTQRLRAAARADEEEAAADGPRRRGRLPRHRAALLGGGPVAAPGARGRRRVVSLAAVGGAALVVGAAVFLWPFGPGGPSGPSGPGAAEGRPSGPVAAVTSDKATPAGEETEAAAEAPDPSDTSSGSEPLALVQTLVDARARAWESGDPAELSEALAPDSPALAADSTDLESAAESGIDYSGVQFTVVDAEVVGGDTEPATGGPVDDSADAIQVAGTVERAPLGVTGPDGPTQVSGSTAAVVWELRRHREGWRIWSWTLSPR